MRPRHNVLAVVAASAATLLAACGEGETAVADGEAATIVLTEFEFNPSAIRLTPGSTVTLELSNEGEEDHEFMIGRELNMVDGVPSGFVEDFFDTVEGLAVEPPDALEGMEDMADGEMADEEMADEEMADDAGEQEDGDHGGHTVMMVVRQPAQTATFTFTVTEASIGEWDIGCFEDDGAHWDDGMKGTPS